MMNWKTGKRTLGILLCTAIFGLAACGNTEESKDKRNEESKEVTTEETSSNQKADQEHWNYDDQEAWRAEVGSMQSPINLKTEDTQKMQDAGKLKLDYQGEVTYIEDNGHSIQAGGKGTAVINGRTFDFKQVHFHAESEHTMDGEHFPLEAHFVNVSKSGRIAVIGVFFKEGKENDAFGEILGNTEKGKKTDSTVEVNLHEMLPANLNDYYHYLGSLTTPPLSENVEWYVLRNPVEVSAEQIKKFKTFYDANNRDIQELGERTILEHRSK